MLQLYIGNKNYSSWSLRPWILLKQLGIPFEERLVPFGAADGRSNFADFSPTGRVPCLVDGTLTVWDSLAITEYLAEQHPAVWPQDPAARAWARCVSAEMHAGFAQLRNICTMNCGIRVRLHTWPPALLADWRRLDAIWCEGIERFGGPFLLGAQFCAADAFFAPVAFRGQTYAPELSSTAAAYLARLRQLPGMLDWYAAALQETWRDEDHEQEARAAGVWLEDLRAPAAGAAAP
jgi:glutathione S-transferase